MNYDGEYFYLIFLIKKQQMFRSHKKQIQHRTSIKQAFLGICVVVGDNRLSSHISNALKENTLLFIKLTPSIQSKELSFLKENKISPFFVFI